MDREKIWLWDTTQVGCQVLPDMPKIASALHKYPKKLTIQKINHIFCNCHFTLLKKYEKASPEMYSIRWSFLGRLKSGFLGQVVFL